MTSGNIMLAKGFVAKEEERHRTISDVLKGLERKLDIDQNNIIIQEGNLIDLFHPESRYTSVRRRYRTTKYVPDVFFIDALDVEGHRKKPSGEIKFLVRFVYDSCVQDIREMVDGVEHRIQPELKRLETYFLTRNQGEMLYTYRSVNEVKK